MSRAKELNEKLNEGSSRILMELSTALDIIRDASDEVRDANFRRRLVKVGEELQEVYDDMTDEYL